MPRRSRRFAWKGTEYKWKVDESTGDLTVMSLVYENHSALKGNYQCLTAPRLTSAKVIATYTNATKTLSVEPRGEELLDQIVVLLVIHITFLEEGQW